MNKHNIFIAMATGILGGPGKGLEQFLRYGGLDGCNPTVIDYVTPKDIGETDFVRTIKATGAPMTQLFQNKTFDLGLVDQALEIVKKNNIEILQSHGYKSHLLCYLLHRKTKLPWIGFVHGWTHENLRVRLYAALEQVLLLGATEIIAVSESLRARLIAPVRRRARVIPNALAAGELIVTRERDEVRKELNIDDETLAVTIIGRLSPEKGHEMFFKAIANVIKEGKKVHAIVVGGGQEHDNLQNLIKELKIENSCSFVGHVRDTANYFNAADIQVMPSTTEGMPNAALEGMHMSLPLIATKVGGIPEVVIDEETGILIPSGDVIALTKSLLRLVNDVTIRESMGKKGKERVRQNFNPHVRAERILALYENVLSKKIKP